MASILSRIVRRLKYGRPVVIVSGLPRSGTSMAMKMLEAGGMELVVDNIRTADEDNPKGYYEDERVKDLAEMKDKEWLDGARGKVIKVVSSLQLWQRKFPRPVSHGVLSDPHCEQIYPPGQRTCAIYSRHVDSSIKNISNSLNVRG